MPDASPLRVVPLHPSESRHCEHLGGVKPAGLMTAQKDYRLFVTIWTGGLPIELGQLLDRTGSKFSRP